MSAQQRVLLEKEVNTLQSIQSGISPHCFPVNILSTITDYSKAVSNRQRLESQHKENDMVLQVGSMTMDNLGELHVYLSPFDRHSTCTVRRLPSTAIQ